MQSTKVSGNIWIDLTPLDDEPQRCSMQLTFNDQGAVEEFEATLTNLTALVANRLLREAALIDGQSTSGTLDDGRQFKATVSKIKSIEFTEVAGSLRIHSDLSQISFTPAKQSREAPAAWVFRLSNVKLSRGDLRTQLPLPSNAPAGATPGWQFDSIEFQVMGRTWRLTDSKFTDWDKLSKEDLAKPILSGTLRTEWRATDKEVDIVAVAQDVAHLLSVALSRAVNWVSYALVAPSGKVLEGRERATYAAPFGKRGSVPINNYDVGVLGSYLEQALPVVAAERVWLHRTLGLLLQAQIADMLDVKCSILYILVDRLSSHIVKKASVPEIDKDLKQRARDATFVAEIHEVLTKLSPSSWNQQLTDSVLSEVKRWNTQPTFVKKVQRACAAVDLPEPDKDLLQPRNDLLHDGELDFGNSDTVKHYLELDWVVLALTLRLFGYEGMYYHPKFGTDPVVMKGQLVLKPSGSAGVVP